MTNFSPSASQMQITDGVRNPAERIRPVDDRNHLARSMSFFRSCKSSDFALAMTIRIRWLTNGDSASARIERPMAPPINRPPPSPPTSTTADWGLRCHELVSFDPMGHVARRTLYKRLSYKVWECYRRETQS